MKATPEVLRALIKKTIKNGARAPELRRYAPELVDVLCSSTTKPADTIRSIWAEELIRRAIGTLDSKLAGYLSDLLALTRDTFRLRVGERVTRAGKHFGVGERTARNYKDAALEHLANALYQQLN